MQIQLAESEKSVRFLVNATKSMSYDLGYSQDQLKKKSDHIADLMKQLQDQTAAAQDMEESFVQKQEELQKALHSAEWLASVAQTRYEKQIEELSEKVEALEKRCQHMEILERQNMELCAIARDRMHTPVQLESHKMHDVDTITSPPNRTETHSVTARTAVAAVTAAAGLAIMSCASRSPQ
jgi:ABC-type transporter Mla subunit MlaD